LTAIALTSYDVLPSVYRPASQMNKYARILAAIIELLLALKELVDKSEA
jgi:hypothetical protein